MVRGLLLAAGLVSLSLVAVGQDKDKPETLVIGKWKLVKSAEPLPVGFEATIEFAKDGKLKLSYKDGGKSETIEGTWKVVEKKLNMTLKVVDKEQKEEVEILKLDDKALHTKDKDGKMDEFERVKEDKK